MSNLWVHAVAPDAGEPPRSVIDQTWHDYTRAGHEGKPGVHDHYVPMGPRGYGKDYKHKGPWTMETSHPDQGWVRCPGHGEDTCTDRHTRDQVHEIAQQNWNLENQHLFDPAGHKRDVDEAKSRSDSFLSDYSLEHPDRVHKIGPNGELLPPDDPRLSGK